MDQVIKVGKTVLHIGEYVKGGIYTYIYELIEYQVQKEEFAVFLLVSEHNSEKIFPLNKESIFFYNYKRNLLGILRAFVTIRKYIDAIKPDIIHVHSTFAGFITRLPLFFSFKRKYKVIYCAHGWSFLIDTSKIKRHVYLFIEKLLSKVTDRIINISHYEHNQALLYGFPKEKCVCIPNGVKLKKTLPDQTNELTQIDHSKINILFVGRFDKQKGVDILLNAIPKIKRKDIHFYLIGDTVLSKQRINKNNENTTFLGWLDNTKVNLWYRQVDAVIMPSRWEGFGLVAIEALSHEKPVIASNRGALPEIIIDGVNGYIFDLHNEDQLLSIIEKLDKDILKKLGKKGNDIYKEKYISERMNLEISKLYRSVLEEELDKE
jgi:glycosyltransferase involved in cell wall biosynthesis